jgi:hypothetical protein
MKHIVEHLVPHSLCPQKICSASSQLQQSASTKLAKFIDLKETPACARKKWWTTPIPGRVGLGIWKLPSPCFVIVYCCEPADSEVTCWNCQKVEVYFQKSWNQQSKLQENSCKWPTKHRVTSSDCFNRHDKWITESIPKWEVSTAKLSGLKLPKINWPKEPAVVKHRK